MIKNRYKNEITQEWYEAWIRAAIMTIDHKYHGMNEEEVDELIWSSEETDNLVWIRR